MLWVPTSHHYPFLRMWLLEVYWGGYQPHSITSRATGGLPPFYLADGDGRPIQASENGRLSKREKLSSCWSTVRRTKFVLLRG